MTEELHPVRLVGKSTVDLEGVFSFDDESNEDDDCRLTLRYAGEEITATDGNYFDALCRIREGLEIRGLRPFCYGSSRNVSPSNMSCQMCGGLRAYRMTLGRPAKQSDLVGIFDSGPDVEPVTVSEQQKYRDEWHQSLSTR